MKRLTAFITAVLMLLSFCSTYASYDTTVSLQINNPIMSVNGEQREIDAGIGTAPIIVNDRTLVPIRAIIEAFGGTVGWNEVTQTVTLKMNSDTVELGINSVVAYHNGTASILDTAPIILNNRTLLPIRYIAESFKLSVDWNGDTSTVTITGSSADTNSFSVSDLPPYSGIPYVTVNNNVPFFTSDEITSISFEYYSELDYLGRCGVCVASTGTDIMPTGERESIGSVKPTAWHSIKYDNVDGKYLYNRCHLIGYQLSSENANVKNLITGTRYMNIEGMLPFENAVADYAEKTGNHVMYRVTPVFEGENLLASGVLMEAYSVEDNGSGVQFCVYCYNVQPGIEINYSDGSSNLSNAESTYVVSSSSTYILNTNTNKFHYPTCSSVAAMNEDNKQTSNDTREVIIMLGFIPCGICKP